MDKLILVKHSLPHIDHNIDAAEWPLAEEGQARAQLLANRLVPYQPRTIISSNEPKAMQTAQIVATTLELPAPTIIADLHEHDRRGVGYMDGVRFSAAVAQFFSQPHVLSFGNETAQQALARFQAAVCTVQKTYPEQTSVVVAHGTVISLFVAAHNALDPFNLWQRLGLPSFVVLSLPDLHLLEVVDKIES